MYLRELAWAAGLFDGEGSTNYRKSDKANGVVGKVSVAVGQSGIEKPAVLSRFASAVGIGKVYGPHPLGHSLPSWQWVAGGFENSQTTIALLWRFLSPVKREQAKLALERLIEDRSKSQHKRRWTTCKHGHSMADARWRCNGKYRICRICSRFWSRGGKYAND